MFRTDVPGFEWHQKTFAPDNAGAAQQQLDPEEMRDRVQRGKTLAAVIGELTVLLIRSPLYQKLPISELGTLAVPAALSGQCAIAEAVTREAQTSLPVAAVLWARVSVDVDQRLAASSDMVLRLAPQEWRSGDLLWVIEALGDRRAIAGILQRLVANDWKGQDARIRVRTPQGEITITTVRTLLQTPAAAS